MPNSQGFVVSQSAWAMDAVENFEISPIYTAANANSGSPGELQNDYTFVHGNNRGQNSGYALSCSNYGITWDPASPAFNPPTYANGTGVQIGYSGSASTSSLPAAGTYKLGSEWNAQIGGSYGFTLAAWVNPISALSNSELGPESNMFIQDWPIFYFGRETVTSGFDGPPGDQSTTGSIYFGLVKDAIGGSIADPANNGMSETYRIAAYRSWKRDVYLAVDMEVADKAYSNTVFTASSELSSDNLIHVAFVYAPHASGTSPIPFTTRAASERLKVYVNGAEISMIYDSDFGEAGINALVNGLLGVDYVCSIGSAKRSSEPLFFAGYPPPYNPPSSGSLLHIFNGTIDEPSVWNVGLSPSEISELYNFARYQDINDLSFAPTKLVSWWRCGETSGDTEGSLGTGIIHDIGPFGADAGNITDMITGVEASASIGLDSGSIVFTPSAPVPGALEGIYASPIYNRKQTLKSVYSVVDPHGVEIPERNAEINNLNNRWTDEAGLYLDEAPLGSIEPYGGNASWEADRLAGAKNPFVSSPRSPFYDSYDDYSVDTKYVFKAGTILSEFRVSDKIEDYVKNEDFLIDKNDDFSIFGIPTGNLTIPQNSSEENFNKFYTNSEFMQFFDIVKTDHDGIAIPSEITVKCNALKKFIPYDGFYPSERTLQIASQFSKSYSEFIEAQGPIPGDFLNAESRPVLSALFSPGIMYNSIKAGIAVDYPVALQSVEKFQYKSFVSGATELTSSGYWSLGTGSNGVNGWDYRVPFEALLEPEEYLQDKNIVDMEPDPSCSLGMTSKLGQSGDNLYKLMMNNFLAEIPEFFLRNDEFTAIRSIPDNSKDFGKVEPGKTYGMRVKIRRSMNTTRKWFHPYFPDNQADGLQTISDYELPQDPLYQSNLQETFTMYSRPSAFGPPVAATSQLYLSPTGSYGPFALKGQIARQSWSQKTSSIGVTNQDLYPSDSLNGYNPSFTPPYYNGEAWADILYTAPSTVTGNVSLDDILNNSKVIYWRIDGRPILRFKYRGKSFEDDENYQFWVNLAANSLPHSIATSSQAIYSFSPSTSSNMNDPDWAGLSAYDPGDAGTGWHFYGASSVWNGSGPYPMAPLHANKFAMQLSASVNLLGREDVLVQDFSPSGIKTQESTVNLSGRWVIQPKFETPMFNFGDQSIRPISSASNTLTIPENAPESVPRGMWHQFGCLPRPNEGIYLEASDIPEKWVEFRGAFSGSEKTVRTSDGVIDLGTYQSEYYADYGAGNGVLSLMDVAGFTQVNESSEIASTKSGRVRKKGTKKMGQVGSQRKISKKLGQLKQGKTVSEAIVAIPFYMEDGNQKLFNIDKDKIQAILDQQDGILSITEDAEIGQSLFDLVAKMQKFVLPPRYDFVNYSEVLNNPEIGAFAMYIFEFNHTFTAEDLSYIWQNVMPNAGLKSVFNQPETESSITHSLVKGELMDAEDFDKEIRWHVFKAKQRAAKDYFEKTTSNNSSAAKEIGAGTPSYNWPYDFFSLIELGNMSTQVSLKKGSPGDEKLADVTSDEVATNLQAVIPKFNYKENE